MLVRVSNTSTETACLKLIFTKFACSMTKGASTPYQWVLSQKALVILSVYLSIPFQEWLGPPKDRTFMDNKSRFL